MYQIVECAGVQFKVAQGDIIEVPLLEAAQETEVTLDKVLLCVDGDSTVIGTPYIGGAHAKATVVEHFKDDKVLVMKKHRRKDYKRKNGHRQQYTRIKITALSK